MLSIFLTIGLLGALVFPFVKMSLGFYEIFKEEKKNEIEADFEEKQEE